MNETVWLLIIICLPSILAAVVSIFPTLIKKGFSNNFNVKEKNRLQKQKCYTELLSLISEVVELTRPQNQAEQISTGKEREESENKKKFERLEICINKTYIIGSVNVVIALEDYLDSWGEVSKSLEYFNKDIHKHLNDGALDVKYITEQLRKYQENSEKFSKEQNRKFRRLILEMRLDLKIDKKISEGFPEIGIRRIQFNHNNDLKKDSFSDLIKQVSRGDEGRRGQVSTPEN